MRICLISTEIFAWGKYGGFGRATRTIGRELVKRGCEVFAVVPRRAGQGAVEMLDGIQVLSFSPRFPWAAKRLFERCDADVYHSCEVSYASHLALKAMPHRRHIATFRDPRNLRDWRTEFSLPSLSRFQVLQNFIYESFLVGSAVRRMDAHYTIGKHLIPKVQRMYRLDVEPRFLPTPVAVPDRIRKAARPTVCYVARLDRRKRPKLFLELAGEFPEVRFIAVGGSRDKSWERSLRQTYGRLANLEMTGFIDQFSSRRHSEALEQSWIMVNCAPREAMPNSFLEAAAHQCAILAGVDPDGFASRFGYHAEQDDFADGLRFLLDQDRWRERGRLAASHIRSVFEIGRAVDLHLEAYEQLLHRKVA